tara:strand:+ start:2097 stop:2486 length:390 start_codon:yes stop_codon:yes gene_type:complete
MSHLTASAAISAHLNGISQGYPVAWENSTFDPDEAEVYLTEAVVPVSTLATFGSDILDGFVTVLAMAGKGSGKGPAWQAANDVELRFPKGLRLTRDGLEVTILRTELGAGFASGERYAVPCSIYYRLSR